jgi:hypothetical protein
MLPAAAGLAPATSGRAAAGAQQLRPLSRNGTPGFSAPHRRSFVLRHARAGVPRASAAPGDEEPAPQSDMARGVVLGALLSNLMTQKSDAASAEEEPAPTSKPAGVLGAALAALMMVRARARRGASRARIART